MSTTFSSTVPVLGSLGADSDVKAEEAHVERFCGQIFLLMIIWFCFNAITKVIEIGTRIKRRQEGSVRYRLQSSEGTSLTETTGLRGTYALSKISPAPETSAAIQGINLIQPNLINLLKIESIINNSILRIERSSK